MKKFTDEQLIRASNIDLVEMLKSQGEQLKKEGKVHRWMRYDSTVIYGNKWFRHSKQVGGAAIQFMQHFYNIDFVDAVKYLLNGEEGAILKQAEHQNDDKPELVIPMFTKNMQRTFAYLIKTRKIDADVVQHFVNEKKIKETEGFHSVAFCGYDENGEMKQIHVRSTAPGSRFFKDIVGSDKQYYFRHVGTSDKVFVFEAPIDMLSFITMNKENWQQHSYVCLGGVAIYALDNILSSNENISQIYMCLDRDKTGDETVERIGENLNERGYEYDRLLPQHKDWNEDLVALRKQEEIQGFNMTM